METEEQKYLWKRRSDVKIHALTNRIYQQERQRIFEMREGLIKALSLVCGSLAFANIATPNIVLLCGAAVVIGNSLSLVFGFGNKARDAARRSAEWTALDRQIDAAGERSFTEAQLDEWKARCSEIESGEPALHPGLFERSYLRACESIGAVPTAKSSAWNRRRPAILLP